MLWILILFLWIITRFYAADTQFFLVDYHHHTLNCGIETLGGVEEATKGKKAPTTADDSDDDAVIEGFKSDKESEFVSF